MIEVHVTSDGTLYETIKLNFDTTWYEDEGPIWDQIVAHILGWA